MAAALLLRSERGNAKFSQEKISLLSIHGVQQPWRDAISQVILGDENAPTMTVFVRGAAATRRWGGEYRQQRRYT